ncbi:MAG: hypothetical protein EA383_05260 [Spirochaetaceae bacterium]|nr:MAG: hypothetical protein EA383_05260 [Spirochaetaceae bacterium]
MKWTACSRNEDDRIFAYMLRDFGIFPQSCRDLPNDVSFRPPDHGSPRKKIGYVLRQYARISSHDHSALRSVSSTPSRENLADASYAWVTISA